MPFREFSKNNIAKIKKQIPKMREYPNDGYIKDMGNFVIVKIGKSYYDYGI